MPPDATLNVEAAGIQDCSNLEFNGIPKSTDKRN